MQGEKITTRNGKLNAPARPVIPFIEGDGTGPDIWRASQRVMDAAVEKAYKGEKKILIFSRNTVCHYLKILHEFSLKIIFSLLFIHRHKTKSESE